MDFDIASSPHFLYTSSLYPDFQSPTSESGVLAHLTTFGLFIKPDRVPTPTPTTTTIALACRVSLNREAEDHRQQGQSIAPRTPIASRLQSRLFGQLPTHNIF